MRSPMHFLVTKKKTNHCTDYDLLVSHLLCLHFCARHEKLLCESEKRFFVTLACEVGVLPAGCKGNF